jgi:hypothetical protein
LRFSLVFSPVCVVCASSWDFLAGGAA